jgi:hypothetical protein
MQSQFLNGLGQAMVLIFLCLVSPPIVGAAQNVVAFDQRELIGAWRVVEVRRQGWSAFRYATGWRGVILFTAEGYYSINVSNTEHRRSDEYGFMDADEAEAGTYTVNAGGVLVTPMVARFTGDIGATDAFLFKLDGQMATITTIRRQRESSTEIRLVRIR